MDWALLKGKLSLIDLKDNSQIDSKRQRAKGSTLLLNEGIPRALKRKKLRLKNILLLPLIFEEMNSFLSFKSEGRIQLEGNF